MKLRPATLSKFYLKQRFIWKGGQIAEALAVLFCFLISILSVFCGFSALGAVLKAGKVHWASDGL